ncbi:hypothetical protein J7M02_01725 [Candidatus Aerophobetes bacterium]|nr:hypothetical protein [Candidatus Aerophobetes bacterium]
MAILEKKEISKDIEKTGEELKSCFDTEGRFKMTEYEIYDWLGKWLIQEKGCQQDEYSQGYLKGVQIADFRPDVVGIRYEIIKEDRVFPVIHFHGYVVEVKKNERGLNEMIGKVIRNLRKAKNHEIGWYENASSDGLHTIRFYIAYPAESVTNDIFEICEENGIGILRLQIIDNSKVYVYEVLKPEEIKLNGMAHSAMRSPGVFEGEMKKINCLRQMFQRPSELFDDFIRPALEKYQM